MKNKKKVKKLFEINSFPFYSKLIWNIRYILQLKLEILCRWLILLANIFQKKTH